MSNGFREGLNMLIADDSLAVREWASHCLIEKAAARVTLSANVEEAITKAACEPLDVILLDLGMPNTEGLAVITALRGMHLTIPIIAMVSSKNRDASLSALRAGADTLLSKPLTWEKIRQSLTLVLSKTRASNPDDWRPGRSS